MFDKKIVEKTLQIPDNFEIDFAVLKEAKHTHTNLDVLNLLTQEKIDHWDEAYNNMGSGGSGETSPSSHTHKNLAVLNQLLPNHIISLNSLDASLAAKADKEHTHSEYVPVIPGKGLSENDFTDAFKVQLEGLNGFNGSFDSLTDRPDMSSYTTTTTVNQLIDAKLENHNVDLTSYVKKDKYDIDMANKADKTHTHNNYRLISDSYTKLETEELVANKANVSHVHSEYVEKEEGKGLSKNDFTDEYKLKLDNFNPGSGEISSIEASKVVEDYTHKFVTEAQIREWTSKATTSYVDGKTGEVTSTVTSFVNQQLSNLDNLYVRKAPGKDLSSNDYTTIEKNKLAGIAENANNYVHPPTHEASEVSVTGGKSLQQAIDDGDIGGSSGSGAIIFDANSEKEGTGTLTSDRYADTGKAIQGSGSGTVIAYFKAEAKLGKYGLSLRAKTEANSSEGTIVKIDILKVTSGGSEQNIKTINFTGTDFESTGSYCWLTSFFDFALAKDEGDKLGIKISATASTTITIDYVAVSPLMSAQFVMG